MQIEIIANQIANTCSAIKHIKAGRLQRAIELLEAGLDGCIIGLGRLKKKGEIPDQIGRDILIDALKIARTHRRRYPRQANKESLPHDPEFQKLVQNILENIED
jgi:hypothetical protein